MRGVIGGAYLDWVREYQEAFGFFERNELGFTDPVREDDFREWWHVRRQQMEAGSVA